MDTKRLNNGLNLIIEPMPNTHSITIGLYIRAGTRYEDKNNGITHLLEHIHFRELNNMSQNELYFKMESIGSTLLATTYYDLLKYSMKIRPFYLKDCVEIFKSILSTYCWSEENIKKEKAVIKNQIEESNSSFSEDSIIRKNLLGNSNLSKDIMGDSETVDSIRLEELISYKRKVFNKNNLVVCVTGCVQQTDIELIEDQLGSVMVAAGDKNVPNGIPALLYHRKPNIVFKHDDWDMTYVNVSFDVDYSKCTISELKILNCILGEGVGSRLQKCVREELSFTSDIASQIELYEDFAFLHIKFSVHKSKLSECLEYVFKTISNIKSNITSDDLAVSLPFYTENQNFLKDDTEQMNYELAYNLFVLNEESEKFPLRNDHESILKLTEAAKKVFVPDNISVIIFGECDGVSKKSVLQVINGLF